MQLRIIQGEDRTEIEVPNELTTATDKQIRSYVNEELHREVPKNTVIDRTSEALILHPPAQYG